MSYRLIAGGLIISLGLGLLRPLSAQETVSVAPVVVSATRSPQPGVVTPASITVITREQIRASGATRLAEVLRGQAGVQIRDLYGDGSTAVADMRGFGPTAGSNTLVLVDGRPLNNASDTAAPNLNSVVLKDVERVEIVQGSAGTLFGNQAVGGIINITTRRPESLTAEIEARAGSYDLRELNASIGDLLANGLQYRVSGRARHTDNYRDHNESELDDLFARIGYSHANGEVFLELQGIEQNLELPGSLFAPEVEQDRRQSAAVFANDYSDTRTRIGRIGFTQAVGQDIEVRAAYADRSNERDFLTSFRAFGPGSPATQDRNVRTFTPGVTAYFRLPGGEGQIDAGIDLEHTDYELVTSFGPQTVDQRIESLFAQAVLPITGRVSLTAGARHAQVSDDIDTGVDAATLDDEVTVGTLGITFQPGTAWRVYARADQNFRFAKVDEHTNVVFPQPIGLANQTGVSYELGGEYSRGGHRAKLLVYQLDTQDEIGFDSSSFFNINLDKTRRRGVTIEGATPISDRVFLGGSYTYTDPEITDGPFEGKSLPLVADHQASLFLDAEVMAGLGLHAELVYVGERVLGGDFENTFDPLPAYSVTNVYLAYEVGAWEVAGRLNNLFDEVYSDQGAIGLDESFTEQAAFFPSPERNFWVSARYSWR
jgi:iron complex outermembrane receptor protein